LSNKINEPRDSQRLMRQKLGSIGSIRKRHFLTNSFR
jgi:hypothetical protein